MNISEIFVVILVFGAFYLNWGQSQYAFALIIFFLVLVGIRLDEVVQQLREVKAHLQTGHEQGEDRAGNLAAIRSTLVSIREILERLEARKP